MKHKGTVTDLKYGKPEEYRFRRNNFYMDYVCSIAQKRRIYDDEHDMATAYFPKWSSIAHIRYK